LLHGFFSLGALNTASYNTIFLAPIATYGAGVGNNYLALARAGYDHTFGPSLMMHLATALTTRHRTALRHTATLVDTFGIPNALPITPPFYCNPSVCPYASTDGKFGQRYHCRSVLYGRKRWPASPS
jgi:hypothetical protein